MRVLASTLPLNLPAELIQVGHFGLVEVQHAERLAHEFEAALSRSKEHDDLLALLEEGTGTPVLRVV